MEQVYILGIYGTPSGNYYDTTFKELVRSAYMGAINDCGMENGHDIEFCYFSNFMADFWGQNMLRGNNFMSRLPVEGVFPARVPIFNLEGGCASASLAFHSAFKDVASGQSEMALAIGVEKMCDPTRPGQAAQWLSKCEDVEGLDEWHAILKQAADKVGSSCEFGPDRSLAMDFYALLAKEHMAAYGTTARQIACAASKNHKNSLTNPRATYHYDMSVDDVLNDRMVTAPLTRSMCAPITDGAAAAVLCSEAYLRRMPGDVRQRAIRIRASAMAGGVLYRQHQDDRTPAEAARRAYRLAGLTPADIDVVELHDASSFAEIHLLEDLKFCPQGQGGPFTEAGHTAMGGRIPVNPSGGLVARGHPIGATGLMMLNELALQLRGEAGPNQVKDAKIAMQENGGGLIGLDVALCSVAILERMEK